MLTLALLKIGMMKIKGKKAAKSQALSHHQNQRQLRDQKIHGP